MQDSTDALKKVLQKLKQAVEVLNPKLKAQDISCEDDIVLKMELCADCILKEVNKGHKKTERTEKAADNYEEIEQLLQKQQNLNRMMIKKELQFKEYQKCLLEELGEAHKCIRKLNMQVSKLEDQVHDQKLQITHLTNEKKVTSRQHKIKEIFTFDTVHNERRHHNKDILKDVYREINLSVSKHQRGRSEEAILQKSKKKNNGNLTRR